MTTKIPAELSSTPGISDSSDATAITITSAENVGIGTTSPETKVEISGSADNALLQALQITNTDHASGETGQQVAINFKLSRAGTMRDAARITAGKDDDWDDAASTDSFLAFDTTLNDQRTERMRIYSGGSIFMHGNVRAGTALAGNGVVDLNGASGTFSIDFIDDGGTRRFAVAASNGDVVNSNNSYGAVSDSKIKENIVDATNKLEDLNKVKVRNFNIKGEEQKQIGVIAQELESIFPNMVEDHKDYDEEGEDLGTVTKSVKYSVFVPMLIKALQEADDKIEALTARIETLEGGE